MQHFYDSINGEHARAQARNWPILNFIGIPSRCCDPRAFRRSTTEVETVNESARARVRRSLLWPDLKNGRESCLTRFVRIPSRVILRAPPALILRKRTQENARDLRSRAHATVSGRARSWW